MRVRFRTNVGSTDAERAGLDFRRCCSGMQLDVSDETGESLIRRGLAEKVVVQAVASPPQLSESKSAPLAGKVKPPSIKEN